MAKLILRIDASAIKESACTLRFYRTIVEGYREKLPTNDMLFGSAFHEFIAEMERTGGNYGAAIQAAKKVFALPCEIKRNKKYLTETFLLKLCMRYWDEYLVNNDYQTVKSEDGKPLVELKFAWPYYVDENVEVLLCGTIDRIAKNNKIYALADYKTTAVFDKDSYLRSYWLNPQLMFYRLILRYYAEAYPDSIFAKINQSNFVVFIDGIFMAGAEKDPEFIRSDVMEFPDTQMAEFERLLEQKVKKLVTHVASGVIPEREGMLNGACETKYGACLFSVACRQSDEIAAQHMLRRNFIQKPYDPLSFNEA